VVVGGGWAPLPTTKAACLIQQVCTQGFIQPSPPPAMPLAARKSSLGGRPKAHIPFRADERGFGKKTNFAAPKVPILMSDGFESFDEILDFADPTPPWLPKGQRSSGVAGEGDDDENWERLSEANATSAGGRQPRGGLG
jgi:hypothetical protein